jgi:hypothetical protein
MLLRYLGNMLYEEKWRRQYLLKCHALNDVMRFSELVLPYLVVKRKAESLQHIKI